MPTSDALDKYACVNRVAHDVPNNTHVTGVGFTGTESVSSAFIIENEVASCEMARVTDVAREEVGTAASGGYI